MIFKTIYMHTLSLSLLNDFNVYLCLGCSHDVMVLWTTGALPKTSKQYWCSSPHCNGQGEHKEHSRVEPSQKQTLWLTPISPNIHEQNKVMFIHILFGTHLPMDLPIHPVDIVLDFAQRPSKRRLMAFCDHWPNKTANGATNGPMSTQPIFNELCDKQRFKSHTLSLVDIQILR